MAVWNLPCKLLGCDLTPDNLHAGISTGVILWNKVLYILLYFVMAREVELIYSETYKDDTSKIKADNNAYWMTLAMPLGFFVAFVMGMYDIVYGVLFTIALRFYYSDWTVSKNRISFALISGIAFTCKMSPFLYFVPLLLLREKKIVKILEYVVLFWIPYMLCALPYMGSSAFRKNVLEWSFSTTSVFESSVLSGVSITLLILGFLCIWCYLRKEYRFNESLFAGNMVSLLFFGFAFGFHPQWIIIAVPFIVLASMSSNVQESFKAILSAVLFLLFVFIKGSENLINNILITGYIRETFKIPLNQYMAFDCDRGLYALTDKYSSVFRTVFAVIFLFYAYISLKRCNVTDSEITSIEDSNNSKIDGKTRLSRNTRDHIIAFAFGLVAFICIEIANYLPSIPHTVYTTGMKWDSSAQYVLCSINDGQVAERKVVIDKNTTLTGIKIAVATWNVTFDDSADLTFTLTDTNGNSTVLDTVSANSLKDAQVNEYQINDIDVGAGDYTLSVSASNLDKNLCLVGEDKDEDGVIKPLLELVGKE
jgi:hypothetical protein